MVPAIEGSLNYDFINYKHVPILDSKIGCEKKKKHIGISKKLKTPRSMDPFNIYLFVFLLLVI